MSSPDAVVATLQVATPFGTSRNKSSQKRASTPDSEDSIIIPPGQRPRSRERSLSVSFEDDKWPRTSKDTHSNKSNTVLWSAENNAPFNRTTEGDIHNHIQCEKGTTLHFTTGNQNGFPRNYGRTNYSNYNNGIQRPYYGQRFDGNRTYRPWRNKQSYSGGNRTPLGNRPWSYSQRPSHQVGNGNVQQRLQHMSMQNSQTYYPGQQNSQTYYPGQQNSRSYHPGQQNSRTQYPGHQGFGSQKRPRLEPEPEKMEQNKPKNQ